MLRHCVGLIVLLGVLPGLQAQIKVELFLKQPQYVKKEPLEVGVRVVNHSGQDLNLTGGTWLDLAVVDSDGFLVKQIGPVPLPEDVSIENSYMGTQWLDITSAFDFEANSRYRVRARVKIKEWNREYVSKEKDFEIIRGSSIWQQKFGVPPKNAGDPPEIRTYFLQQAIYLKQPQLYLRVTDEGGQHIIAVRRLAPFIQVSEPQAQVDTLSRLHVFTQINMNDFAHIIVNPDGVVEQRHTYIAQGLRPSLKVSPSGSVYVAGGARELRRTDIPTPEMFLARVPDSVEILQDASGTDAAVVPELTVEDVTTKPETVPAPVPAPVEDTGDPLQRAQEALEKRTSGQE